MNSFVYVMDPMCSWCWAFSTTMERLKGHFPNTPIEYVMGGLAPDSDHPMSVEMRQYIQQAWKQIEQKTGTSFNHQFWDLNTPKRSTYPACRAVITASMLEGRLGIEKMVSGIQKAYYLEARNPSDMSTLEEIAVNCGFNREAFSAQMESDKVEQQLKKEIIRGVDLGTQGFPSLFYQTKESLVCLSAGYSDWKTVEKKLIAAGISPPL